MYVYPYILIIKRPEDRFPIEYPCVSLHDVECTYNIFVDRDDYEVQCYEHGHEIVPDFIK